MPLQKGAEGSIIKPSTVFYKRSDGEIDRDPLRKVMGSIKDSHPEEMERIIKEAEALGVEIRWKSKDLAYGAGIRKGKKGQLHLNDKASYGAWLHEERHMLDDFNDGWAGFRVLEDIPKSCKREFDAYAIEIELAFKLGETGIAKELRQLCDNAIRDLGGDIDDFTRNNN